MTLTKILSNLLWAVAYGVSLLPLKVLYFISDLCFWIGYLLSYRRSVIIQNLSRSFPDKKYKEIAQIGKRFTHYFFNLFAEWLKLVSISEKTLSKYVHFENVALLEQYRLKNQAVILVMGHYGNWEYLNLLPLQVKQPVYAVYKKLRNPIINRVSGRLRKRFGVQLVESKEASRFVLRNRKTPSVYLFIADQSPSHLNKECFSFLNQPTSAFVGVEKLAKATGAAVVYVEIMPQKRGYYTISFADLPENRSITAGFLSALEGSIRKSPMHWLWSHRRWKHTVSTAA